MIKRFLHRWFHFWDAGSLGRTLSFAPCDNDRPGAGFCVIRQCTVCRKVAVNAFALFGDKKWYGLDEIGLHCWDTELENILRALRYHRLIEPECPDQFYPEHPHLVIKRDDTACECACGCTFNWRSPCHWKVLTHGKYFRKPDEKLSNCPFDV